MSMSKDEQKQIEEEHKRHIQKFKDVIAHRSEVDLETHIDELYEFVGNSYYNPQVVSNLIVAASIQLMVCGLDEVICSEEKHREEKRRTRALEGED